MKDGVSVKWSSCAATSFRAGDPWESVGNEVSDSGSLVSVQSPLTRGHLFVAFRGLLGRLVRLGRCRVCDDGQMGSLLMGLLVGVFVRDDRSHPVDLSGGEKIWEWRMSLLASLKQ